MKLGAENSKPDCTLNISALYAYVIRIQWKTETVVMTQGTLDALHCATVFCPVLFSRCV